MLIFDNESNMGRKGESASPPPLWNLEFYPLMTSSTRSVYDSMLYLLVYTYKKPPKTGERYTREKVESV